MDTKKVIVTLLVLTIILSVLTVAFTLTGGRGNFDRGKNTDQATVGLYIEPTANPVGNNDANVGLYVNN